MATHSGIARNFDAKTEVIRPDWAAEFQDFVQHSECEARPTLWLHIVEHDPRMRVVKHFEFVIMQVFRQGHSALDRPLRVRCDPIGPISIAK